MRRARKKLTVTERERRRLLLLCFFICCFTFCCKRNPDSREKIFERSMDPSEKGTASSEWALHRVRLNDEVIYISHTYRRIR